MFVYRYNNIMNLAKENNYKKIMVMRNSWGYGSWCIVDKVVLKSNGYGYAYGIIKYSDGNNISGSIPCAGNYAWRVIKVLDEDMEVEHI